ncbi:MAG: asparagine synthase (glutamine-hydrolyzing) [Hyphomicrobiaceae bacterium]
MCGIGGLLDLAPIDGLAAKLNALSSLQSHRGPDDLGFLTWRDGEAAHVGRDAARMAPGRLALVHRRLSILDLSPLGAQPMLSASGRQAIVFNGEIYNYRELKAELEAVGHRFVSTSDTEVLLAILGRDGIAGLKRLVGMYAFAYADFDSRTLVLARDPFGIKPLHYVCREGRLAFASTITPLLAIGAARQLADRAALFSFLRHGVTNAAGVTVFADVREVEPGSVLEVPLDAPGAPRTRPHAQPTLTGPARKISAGEAADELRAILVRNVELHLRADVPCAAALSGGVDSSGIVTLMRRQLGDAAPLDVFTYVADAAHLSERRYAGIVAEAAGARVHEVHLDPDRLAGEIDDLIRHQEQPFTTTSMWAQAHVYRAAHDAGFKIVLDGQGADEVLAGYAAFRPARLEGLLRRGRLLEAGALLRQLPSASAVALVQAAGGLLPGSARSLARRLIGRPVVPDWLDARWFGPAAGELAPATSAATAPSPLQAALRTAVVGSSLPMLLRYADRNAMAVSVENRVPFLTGELVSFAFGLPDEILIDRQGTLKRVLRDALRGLVPDAVLDRRDKIGFETPEAQWFARHESVRRIASEAAALPLPPCFTAAIREEIGALGRGTRPYAPYLWRAINVIRWSALFDVAFDDCPGSEAAA